MKILWLINIVLPSACNALCWETVNSGGWLTGSIHQFKNSDVEIVVCSPTSKVKKITIVETDENKNYIIPFCLASSDTFRRILKEEKPDLVHIHGTEFRHSLEMVSAVEKNYPLIISIQGIISECAKVYLNGLPKSLTEKDMLHKIIPTGSVVDEKDNFLKRGEDEIQALKNAENVMGRTDWDKKAVLAINPKLKYFKVNESLRDCFYTIDRWKYENCLKHSIFVSQADYPIKGFHQLLKAMPKILKEYPDTHVYVGGRKLEAAGNFFTRYYYEYIMGYQGYLNYLIRKSKLESHITFLGTLSADKMKSHYLKSNVFVSCSNIENSSNSIGEAMMLGMPVVASNTGGTKSILTHEKDGLLYDYDDIKQLYADVCTVFGGGEKVNCYCDNARKHAQITHDTKTNFEDTLNCYKTVIEQFKAKEH